MTELQLEMQPNGDSRVGLDGPSMLSCYVMHSDSVCLTLATRCGEADGGTMPATSLHIPDHMVPVVIDMLKHAQLRGGEQARHGLRPETDDA